MPLELGTTFVEVDCSEVSGSCEDVSWVLELKLVVDATVGLDALLVCFSESEVLR